MGQDSDHHTVHFAASLTEIKTKEISERGGRTELNHFPGPVPPILTEHNIHDITKCHTGSGRWLWLALLLICLYYIELICFPMVGVWCHDGSYTASGCSALTASALACLSAMSRMHHREQAWVERLQYIPFSTDWDTLANICLCCTQAVGRRLVRFPAELTAEALDIWAVQNVHELTHNSRLNLKIWRGNVLNSPLFMFFFFLFFVFFSKRNENRKKSCWPTHNSQWHYCWLESSLEISFDIKYLTMETNELSVIHSHVQQLCQSGSALQVKRSQILARLWCLPLNSNN